MQMLKVRADQFVQGLHVFLTPFKRFFDLFFSGNNFVLGQFFLKILLNSLGQRQPLSVGHTTPPGLIIPVALQKLCQKNDYNVFKLNFRML